MVSANGDRELELFQACLDLPESDREARGNSITARELLDRGAGTIDTELGGQPEVRANLLGTLSQVHESLGLYRESVALADKALAVQRAVDADEGARTAAVLLTAGRSRRKLGEFEAAERALEQALALRIREFGEHHLEVARVVNALGGLHWELVNKSASHVRYPRRIALRHGRVHPGPIRNQRLSS